MLVENVIRGNRENEWKEIALLKKTDKEKISKLQEKLNNNILIIYRRFRDNIFIWLYIKSIYFKWAQIKEHILY